MANKRLRILVNDNAIHDSQKGIYALKSWDFTSTYQRAIDTFSFVLSYKDIDNVWENDEIKVYIDDDLVFKGVVDSTEEVITNDSDDVKVQCRDYMGQLADNDAVPNVWSSALDTEIYNSLTAEFDFITSVTNTGQNISKYEISTGENVYDAMAAVALKNNKYLRLTPLGELIIAEIADEGDQPTIIINIEDGFTGTARILRSIKDACSEINMEGHIAATSSGSSDSSSNSSNIFNATIDVDNLGDVNVFGDTSSNAVSSSSGGSSYWTTLENSDASNNVFRTLGTNKEVKPSNRPRSSFQKRKYMSISGRSKTEIASQSSTYLQRNPVEHKVTLDFNDLYYLAVNTVIRLKSPSRQIDHNMYIQEISMSESTRQRRTTMTLRLPGRIK